MRRRIAACLLFAFVLAGCGGDSSLRFYDENARALAEQTARTKPDGPHVASVGSANERSDCSQAPSGRPGPCLRVEVRTADEARPVGGGPSKGTVRTKFDVFVWLTKKRGRWKVTYTTFGPPRDVSFNGIPYSPAD